MRGDSLSLVFFLLCASLFGDETPLPLGASDLVPDTRLNAFKSKQQVLSLEKAIEVEAIKQLDWVYEAESVSEIELLKKENRLLKIRVAKLERRLVAIEAKLEERSSAGGSKKH